MLIKDIRELIGGTPILQMRGLAKAFEMPPGWKILFKLENQNPGRSVKDRAGLALLEWFRMNGSSGSIAIEGTSGNTGIGLSVASLGDEDRPIIYADSLIPLSKLRHMRLLGIEPVVLPLTEREEQEQSGAILRAQLLSDRSNNEERVIWLNQYGNAAYPDWHFRTTAPEIFAQCPDVSLIVSSVGTGGTISGIAKYIAENKIRCRTIAVEPIGSVMFGNAAGPYLQRGSGNAFQTGNLWTDVIDDFVQVSDLDAAEAQMTTARTEGIFIGDSSGAAVVAAVRAIQLLAHEHESGCAVVVVSDCGIKYLRDTLRAKVLLQTAPQSQSHPVQPD
jgi:cysteine synthase